MSDLNKRFFKAKAEHHKSYRKGSYVLWIALGIVVISSIVANIQGDGTKNSSQIFNSGNYVSRDSLTSFEDLKMKILVVGNSYLKREGNNAVIVVNDSSALSYLVKKTGTTLDSALTERWQDELKKKNPTYRFFNTKQERFNDVSVERSDLRVDTPEGKELTGKLAIYSYENKVYLLQISCYSSYFPRLSTKINEIENSWQVMK